MYNNDVKNKNSVNTHCETINIITIKHKKCSTVNVIAFTFNRKIVFSNKKTHALIKYQVPLQLSHAQLF